MTETTVDQQLRYSSPVGIDMDCVPWRLYDKAKRLFWDPADIDFSKDPDDWARLPTDQQMGVASTALAFMIGEEAVTLDIMPLVRAVSIEGRLEETMFLTTFALEEAKHIEFFRRWADAVKLDFTPFLQVARQGYGSGNSVFDGELERVMTRLETDPCPEAFLDASLTYNQFVEGVLALSAYRMADRFFSAVPGLPGLQEGLSLIQRDERRHIAYGTYLARRIIAEHPETWSFVERRWAELTEPYLAANRGRNKTLVDRRLEALAVARDQGADLGSADELEAMEE